MVFKKFLEEMISIVISKEKMTIAYFKMTVSIFRNLITVIEWFMKKQSITKKYLTISSFRGILYT